MRRREDDILLGSALAIVTSILLLCLWVACIAVDKAKADIRASAAQERVADALESLARRWGNDPH